MSEPITSRSTKPLLFRARGVVAGYGQGRVLHGVDLDIHAGETVGLLGRNGAGRSTFLKAVMRLVPARGSVTLDGVELSNAQPHRVARAGIGYVPEDRGIFSNLSVRENLSVGRAVRGGAKRPEGIERQLRPF